jgi:hypothetical protein
VRRLLVLGLFALLPACAVEIDDPGSGEVGETNTELVEGEGTTQPAAAPEQGGSVSPEVVSPESRDPGGPTPDPWSAGPTGPTPDPWVTPEPQKKTAH